MGDRLGEGYRLGSLGLGYYHLGEPRKAIEYYELARKIAREIGHRRVEGTCLFNMGLAFDKLDQRSKAIELAKSALEIFTQTESPSAEQVKRQLEHGKIKGNRT
jgi:tetratricopeptide (TPR) repeat protein